MPETQKVKKTQVLRERKPFPVPECLIKKRKAVEKALAKKAAKAIIYRKVFGLKHSFTC